MKGNLIGATPFQEYHIDGALGDDNNDGLAWGADSAFATIGKFMTVAAALGTRGRVRGNVAPGARQHLRAGGGGSGALAVPVCERSQDAAPMRAFRQRETVKRNRSPFHNRGPVA